jgi:TolB-like protein/DNA-binding winged helix-turn-helix (wHTH) protein
MSEETGWRSTSKDLREAPRLADRRLPGGIPEIYEFGPFRLEPAERKLLRGNEVVALTPKAFDTLQLLIRNSGHLLEKDELIGMLWPQSVVEEGNLTNNIFLLRKALGEDVRYIETVPKKGYRFVGAVRRLPTPEPARPEIPLEGRSESAHRRQPDAAPGRLTTETAAQPEAAAAANTFNVPIPRGRRAVAIAVVVAVLVSTSVLTWVWMAHRDRPATTISIPERSIAVLPFVDMSEKHDQEYFADGMAEEVIDLLARIPGLKVIGRASSFQFKGKSPDVRTVGSGLGVNYVVEGSVRKSGDRLRVTAQLLGTQDGSHVWSDTYDEPVGDALSIQDEIAADVVRALQLSVGAAEYVAGRSAFNSPQAYDLFLKGLHAHGRFDRQGLETAAAYFQKVLELDPNSVPAIEWLAWNHAVESELLYVEPAEGFGRARQLAQRALQLDPKSSLAYQALAYVHYVYDWDWAAAERDAKEAIRLKPNDSGAIGELGDVYRALGRWNESVRLYETATTLDPLSAPWHSHLRAVWLSTGRLREAEAEARRVLQITPTYAGGHRLLGEVLLAQGKPEAALAEMQQESSNWRDVGLTMAYHALGHQDESDAAFARLVREHAHDDAADIAAAYGYRRELDQAFVWLDRAYRQRDSDLWTIKLDQGNPLLNDYAKDPRFTALLRKMNLPE